MYITVAILEHTHLLTFMITHKVNKCEKVYSGWCLATCYGIVLAAPVYQSSLVGKCRCYYYKW